MAWHREAFAPGALELRRSPTDLLGCDRDPDRAFGWYRPVGFAEHVDESAQRDRHLPVPGIIKEQPFEGGRPVLQNAKQPPRAQERAGKRFDRVRNSQPVDCRANGQIGVVDHEPAVQRNPS